jgi:hypothetical protein
VERILPHKLVIQITEREPIAQVCLFHSIPPENRVEKKVFYLDDQGCAMEPASSISQQPGSVNEPGDWLPTITGVLPSDVSPGKKTDSAQIQAALGLIMSFEKSSLAGLAEIAAIDVATDHTLEVTTTQGTRITFLAEGFEPQFRRWRSIHDFAARTERVPASLDLAVSNYIPVRWFEAGTAPARVLPHKPNRSRKRHV